MNPPEHLPKSRGEAIVVGKLEVINDEDFSQQIDCRDYRHDGSPDCSPVSQRKSDNYGRTGMFEIELGLPREWLS